MDDFEMAVLFIVGALITVVLAHSEYIHTNDVTGRSLVPLALLLIYMLGCQLVKTLTDPELCTDDTDEYEESEEE